MDQSLKVQAGAIKVRNVLTRAERVTRLKELERWSDDESNVVGMPKVRVMKVSLKKKKKVKKADEADDKKGKKGKK
jgi:small basic protein (TIGR04137 family)